MKKSLVLFIALIVVCAFGCNRPGSTGAGGKKLTIAVIPKGTTHEFWKSIHAGSIKAARELSTQGTEVQLIWQGPLREDDREQQIKVVEGFTAQGISGVVLAPLDSRALVRPVDEAKRAGLPTVIIDSALESNAIVSFVATDNRKGGTLAADRMGQLLNGKGKVLVLRYQLGSASTEEREAGFIEQMKKNYPNIEIVSSEQYAGATRDTAKTISENLLNQFGDELQGIFTPNESTTAGMLLALQDRGKAGKITFVGFDASQTFIDAMRANQLHGIVLQNPMNMGYLGVSTMVQHLLGKPIEKRIDTGVTLVTKENLDSSEAQALLHPPLGLGSWVFCTKFKAQRPKTKDPRPKTQMIADIKPSRAFVGSGVMQKWLNRLGPLFGLVLVILVFSVLMQTPERYLSPANLRIVLAQTVIVAIGAIGMTMIIISGGIDLSVGSTIALTGVITALALNAGWPPSAAVVAGILVGAFVGLVNGLAITRLRVVPFIATLGMLGVGRGVAKWVAGQQTVNVPESWINELLVTFPNPPWLLVAPGVWIALVLAFLAAIVLRNTVFGRRVFALGSNEAAARACGIATDRLKLWIYALAGLLFGLAGVMQMSRLRQGDPTVAAGSELDVIAAVVIGGGSLNGGEGSILGSMIGGLIMAFLRNGCQQIGWPNYIQEIIIGAIIVVAVALDRWRTTRATT
jgi:ribose/xylose/arabinose/galactoside ABC-type transport system permease subunit/ABC-type sugar transport system substrate-binding protein